MIYLFDSSALVAHALRQPAASEVQAIMDDEDNGLLLSALSLFELAGVLNQHGAAGQIPELWRIYGEGLELVPVDSELAKAAWRLREKVGKRIPMVDAIIAATAQARGATLVHRDQHLALIPQTLIPQLLLPSSGRVSG